MRGDTRAPRQSSPLQRTRRSRMLDCTSRGAIPKTISKATRAEIGSAQSCGTDKTMKALPPTM